MTNRYLSYLTHAFIFFHTLFFHLTVRYLPQGWMCCRVGWVGFFVRRVGCFQDPRPAHGSGSESLRKEGQPQWGSRCVPWSFPRIFPKKGKVWGLGAVNFHQIFCTPGLEHVFRCYCYKNLFFLRCVEFLLVLLGDETVRGSCVGTNTCVSLKAFGHDY